MRQFSEKNGGKLHFCLFSKWTMVSSPLSRTMGIWYNSWCFVRTIRLAHLSWRAHLCQGCLHTCSRAWALQAWTLKSPPNVGELSTAQTLFSCTLFPLVPGLPGASLMHCQDVLLLSHIALLAVPPIPRAYWCLFLLSTLSKDTDLPFHLLSVLLLCPPATSSLVWANLSHGVEQLPTKRGCFQQHLPSPCLTLAPRLSSPLVSQFKRIVFCWINKLDRLTVWFDVVQERVWTSKARSQGGKSRTTQVRTVSWLSRVMKLHPYLLRII